MDPKVLLMPVYSRGNEIERLRGALSLTRYFDAHLNVIFAQSKPSDLLGREVFAMSAPVREQIISILDAEAKEGQVELEKHFEALCAEYGVSLSSHPQDARPTASWREIQGARSELVALYGRVSDLVIIPHSTSGAATQTFEEAVLHTGRPVFLVPRGWRDAKLSKALIGWDGGLECVRAVQHALPFLKRMSAVTIAVGVDPLSDRPNADAAAHYLAYHGVSANIATFSSAATTPGAAILDMAVDQECDLLVTGAYAHTRLRQTLLGSVTNHLLKHAEIPVLMAH